MNHRHAEIALEDLDDLERAPARTLDVDSVRPGICEKQSLHVLVERVRRNLADRLERRFERRHGENVETRLAKVAHDDFVLDGRIAGADDLACAERTEGRHVVRTGCEELRVVLRAPFVDAPALALKAQQHERRRAGGVDHLAARLCEARHITFVMGQRFVKLLDLAAFDIEVERHDAQSVRQQADDFFRSAGAHRWHDHSSHAAPA